MVSKPVFKKIIPEKREGVDLRPPSLDEEGGNRFDGFSNAMRQTHISSPCFAAIGAAELNVTISGVHNSNL